MISVVENPGGVDLDISLRPGEQYHVGIDFHGLEAENPEVSILQIPKRGAERLLEFVGKTIRDKNYRRKADFFEDSEEELRPIARELKKDGSLSNPLWRYGVTQEVRNLLDAAGVPFPLSRTMTNTLMYHVDHSLLEPPRDPLP